MWRRELGMSLREVAVAIGSNYSTVSGREKSSEKHAAGDSAYRDRNRDAIRKRQKTWEDRNRESVRLRCRKYHEENRDLINARQRARRQELSFTVEGRITALVSNARERARKAGLVFDRDLLEAVLSSDVSRCACCGDFLDYLHKAVNKSPSLDRIDNVRGYECDNVAVVCSWCNKLKRNATIQQFEMLIFYMKKHPSVR